MGVTRLVGRRSGISPSRSMSRHTRKALVRRSTATRMRFAGSARLRHWEPSAHCTCETFAQPSRRSTCPPARARPSSQSRRTWWMRFSTPPMHASAGRTRPDGGTGPDQLQLGLLPASHGEGQHRSWFQARESAWTRDELFDRGGRPAPSRGRSERWSSARSTCIRRSIQSKTWLSRQRTSSCSCWNSDRPEGDSRTADLEPKYKRLAGLVAGALSLYRKLRFHRALGRPISRRTERLSHGLEGLAEDYELGGR